MLITSAITKVFQASHAIDEEKNVEKKEKFVVYTENKNHLIANWCYFSCALFMMLN